MISVLVLAGCAGEAMDLDAGTELDAIEGDAGTDGAPGIDGPGGPCPFVPAPPPTSSSGAPTGAWAVTWRCIGGCATYPRPDLTTATRVDVTAGGLRWSNGAEHATTNAGACRRAAADETGCRAYYDLCASGGGVRIEMVTWFDVNTQWRQTWEATGTRIP